MLRLALLLAAAALGLWLLDRLCLRAEARGWIFYRRRKPSGNALGATTLALQKIFESGKAEHVIEAQAQRPDDTPEAGPPRPAKSP